MSDLPKLKSTDGLRDNIEAPALFCVLQQKWPLIYALIFTNLMLHCVQNVAQDFVHTEAFPLWLRFVGYPFVTLPKLKPPRLLARWSIWCHRMTPLKLISITRFPPSVVWSLCWRIKHINDAIPSTNFLPTFFTRLCDQELVDSLSGLRIKTKP